MYTPPKKHTLAELAEALNGTNVEAHPITKPHYPHAQVSDGKCVTPSNANVSGDGAMDITGNVVTTSNGSTCRPR